MQILFVLILMPFKRLSNVKERTTGTFFDIYKRTNLFVLWYQNYKNRWLCIKIQIQREALTSLLVDVFKNTFRRLRKLSVSAPPLNNVINNSSLPENLLIKNCDFTLHYILQKQIISLFLHCNRCQHMTQWCKSVERQQSVKKIISFVVQSLYL